jgi:hypothetical protein
MLLPILLFGTIATGGWGKSELHADDRRHLMILVASLFVLSGYFTPIANLTSMQPSLFLLLGFMGWSMKFLSNPSVAIQNAGVKSMGCADWVCDESASVT